MRTTTDLEPVARFVAEIRARGVQVEERDAGRLRVGPSERLTPEEIERLQKMRGEILTIVRSAGSCAWPCSRCGRFSFPLPSVCYWCRWAEERPVHA